MCIIFGELLTYLGAAQQDSVRYVTKNTALENNRKINKVKYLLR